MHFIVGYVVGLHVFNLNNRHKKTSTHVNCMLTIKIDIYNKRSLATLKILEEKAFDFKEPICLNSLIKLHN